MLQINLGLRLAQNYTSYKCKKTAVYTQINGM